MKLLATLAVLLVLGCGGDDDPAVDGGRVDGSVADGSVADGASFDAFAPDASEAPDAAVDAALPVDGGTATDATVGVDVPDAEAATCAAPCDAPPGPCFEATGLCVAGTCEYAERAGSCDDGNPCTTGDMCVEGGCVGTPVVCDAPPGACFEAAGVCVAGACEYGERAGSCDDGNPCTTGDVCVEGGCVGTPVVCDAPPGSCFEAAGVCVAGACEYAERAGSCDDGDACTVEDMCVEGGCVGTPLRCDTPPAPCLDVTGACEAGACVTVTRRDGTSCEGGACLGGVCAQALRGVVQVVAGQMHTCARLFGGEVRCWGRNAFGQLGDGTTEERRAPTRVIALPPALALSAGGQSTCAIVDSGEVYCWGSNAEGQLGTGDTDDRSSPTLVLNETGTAPLTNVEKILVGTAHTCARLTSGQVRCWGHNQWGQVGDGTVTRRTRPTAVLEPGGTGPLTSIADLFLGSRHACGLTTTGALLCWGANGSGALGDGTTTPRLLPVPISLNDVTQLRGGGSHTCARLVTGRMMCWGANSSGQLGDGTTSGPELSPVEVYASGVAETSAGLNAHTCARFEDGSVRCWGLNSDGQVGDGTTVSPRLTGRLVGGLEEPAELATGFAHSCARVRGGELRCWGDNGQGQLGDGTSSRRTSPVAVLDP
ncbi:MAG: hypothetical protein KF901_10095 [Myxococcales bacterium]|nr:hypothetical protein [Myxococcales bacterium]